MTGPMIDNGNTCQETTEPEVRHWLNRLAKALNTAAELQKQVIARVSCVMRDGPGPQSAECADKPEVQLTVLANEIRVYVQHLDAITNAYEDMLSRIELPTS